MNHQTLHEIIDSPFSTENQRVQAQALLDSLKPKPTPAAPTGNVTLNGTYPVFTSARVEPKVVKFSLIVSPAYFAELRKKWPTNDPSSNEFANHAHDQYVNVLVDFFLEFDLEKRQLLLAPALAKFPEFEQFIKKETA